ncbi:putative Ig domain-containing protein [Pseudomonas sp. ABC1]|uniref:beta-propeller fold lactonase family protein n=1 Tax=Pseudomonas sp. ABC1 TaxID=2748080 RepID=UPI0015C3F0C0|nr:beta-propeller fold lactonase family protein [Pseudomonas sp. ABC1]QLF94363.1 putative Ig domain-containing protein [Pseudomonas sp. ABC1]
MTTRKHSQRYFRALALEPRILLDAAAVATADAVAEQQETQDTAPDTAPSLSVIRDDLSYLGTSTGTFDSSLYITPPGDVSAFVNSEDGNRVYTLSTLSTWSGTTYTFVSVWGRNDDGTLTFIKGTNSSNQDVLNGATQIALADDGDLYIVSDKGLSLFSVDNTTGTLTLVSTLDDTTLASMTLTGDIAVSGNHVLLSGLDEDGSSAIKVFLRDGDTLSLLATYTGDDDTILTGANDIARSQDGKFLFVATSGATTQVSVFSIADNGSLAYVGAYGSDDGTEHFTSALALSADGKNLYALEYDGQNTTLTTFDITSSGALTATDTLSVTGRSLALAISGDDNTLYVTGAANDNALRLFSRASDGTLALTHTYSSSSVNGFSNLSSIHLSADGLTAYVAGTKWSEGSLLVLRATPSTTTYTEGSTPVLLLPGAQLNDDDYTDAVVSIERKDGASTDDIYGFANGNGLTLDADSGEIRLDDGTLVATFAQLDGTLTIQFSEDADQATAQSILRQINYTNSSQDPTAQTSTPTFTISYTDATDQQAVYERVIELIGVNDAPVLTSQPLNPDFEEQGDPAPLFSNTEIDTIEQGQTLWQVQLELENATQNDVIVTNGLQIALGKATSGTVTVNGQTYMIRVDGTKTTLILYVTGKSAEETSTLIDGLAYLNTANDITGERTIALKVLEQYESSNNYTSLSVSTTVSLQEPSAPNTAPSLEGVDDSTSYTEKSGPILLIGDQVSVSDEQMDALDGGNGNYDRSAIVIQLGDGYDSRYDALGFQGDDDYSLSNGTVKHDGTTIATWSIDQQQGTLTITFTAAYGTKPTSADVEAVLQRITYQNTSVDPTDSLHVSVTFKDQTGLASETAALTIELIPVNDLPELSVDPILSLEELTRLQTLDDIDGLSSPVYVTSSADGSRVYIANASGAIALFTRDTQSGELTFVSSIEGAGSINQLAIASDGKDLYAVRSNSILHFSVAEDGALTLVSEFSDNIWSMKDIAISEDGKNIYLIDNYTVIVLTRDTETGALSKLAELPRDMNTEPYLWSPSEIVSRGDYVYVVTNTSSGSTLIAFLRDEQGNLTAISNSRSDTSTSLQYAQHIAVSADGLTIFVANSRTSETNGWTGQTTVYNHAQRVDGFTLDPATGKLTHTVTITGTATVEDLAISADGKSVLVTLSDGTLNHYAINGELATTEQITGAKYVATTDDGGVIVIGTQVSVLELAALETPTFIIDGDAVLPVGAITLSDAELDLRDDYNGAKVTFSSDTRATAIFGFSDSDTFKLVGNTIQKDGVAVATLVDGVLTFTSSISRTDAQAIVRQVNYRESGTVPVGTRTISAVLNDGEDDSNSYVASLIVPAVPGTEPTLGIIRDDLSYLGTSTGTFDSSLYITPPGDVSAFVNSEDGNRVYTLSTLSTWSGTTYTFVSVWGRNDDGTLTFIKGTNSSNQDVLNGATQIALADDGDLYIVSDKGLSLFSVDNTTGTLTLVSTLDDTTLASMTLTGDIAVSGNHVLLSGLDEDGSSAIKVFLRDGDTLSLLATYTGDDDTILTGANDIARSQDGKFLFVATSGATTQVSVFSIADNGSLAYVGAYGSDDGTEHFTSALALSADGKNLYALEYDGQNTTLTTFDITSSGALTATDTLSVTGRSLALAISGDDNTLYVTGAANDNALRLFSRASDGTLALTHTYSSSSVNGFSNLSSIHLSADGLTAYVAGTKWSEGSLLVLRATPSTTTYTEGSTPVLLLPGAQLNDDDYTDAVVSIERKDGASTDDIYGFANGNGLTLDADSGEIRLDDGTLVATFAQLDGTLTIQFSEDADQATAQSILRQINYTNSSQDPTAQTSTPTFTISYTDATDQQAVYERVIELIGVNDAPVLTSQPLNPDFEEQGDPAPLFSNTEIDTIEQGQTLWQVQLELENATQNDVIVTNGLQIALGKATSGTVTVNGQTYMIRVDGTKTTLILYVTGKSAEETSTLIDGLAYLNTANDITGERTIALKVLEQYESSNNYTSLSVSTTVSLQEPSAPNTAPSLEGVDDSTSYTEKSGPILLIGDQVSVSDEQMDALDGGNGNYDRSAIVIQLGDGYDSRYDALGFQGDDDYSLSNGTVKHDGTTIATWSIDQQQGTLTITFTAAYGTKPTSADVEAVLQRITYQNTSVDPTDSLHVSVTFKDQTGLASETAALTIELIPVNDLPGLSVDPILSLEELTRLQTLDDIDGLSSPVYVTSSADGSRVYIANASGAIALFTRDTQSGELTFVSSIEGAGSINQLAIASDGKDLYAVRSNSILHFSVAEDGALTLVSEFSDNIWSMKDIAISEDGKNIYLIDNYTVIVLTRDTETGALSKLAELPRDMNTEPYLWSPSEIVSRGDYVYVVTNTSSGSTLIAFLRDEQGNLTAISNSRSDTSTSLQYAQHIAVSADGLTIFVANSRTSETNGWTGQTTVYNHAQRVDGFTLDPATGKLTHTVTITGTATVEDLAISADGKSVLVTLSDGTLNHYAINGELATTEQITGAKYVATTDDGGVIVIGTQVSVLELAALETPTFIIDGDAVLPVGAITLSDAELDLRDDYNGAKVTFSSDTRATAIFGFSDSDTFKLVGNTIQKDGVAVATLVDGVLTFTSSISRTDAQAIVRQVNYRESGTVPVGTRTISAVLNDGEDDSNSYVASLAVIEINIAPTLTAGPLNPSYTADEDAVALFGNAEVSTGGSNQDQSIIELTLRVDGVGSRGDEWLVLDGQQVQLKVGQSGELDNGLSYTVTRSGNTLIISLKSGTGVDTASIRTLVEGMRYGSDDYATAGTRSINISLIRDDGGTYEDGVDTGYPAISSTVEVTAVNHAPTPADSDFNLVNAEAGSTYRVELPASLFIDSDGDSLSWSVTGLPAGFGFDPATRVISGNTAELGEYEITVTAQDQHGASASLTLALNVAEAPAVNEVTPEVRSDTPVSSGTPLPLGFSTQPFERTSTELREAANRIASVSRDSHTPSTSLVTGQSGFDSRTTIAQQLAQADLILRDAPAPANSGSFYLDGNTLRTSLVLPTGGERQITLSLPTELPDNSAVQRVTLANGMPVPNGLVSLDTRTGQLNIDREWLKRNGGVRLTLISQDADGNERKTPVVIQVTNDGSASNGREPAAQQSTETAESLPQQLRQETSSALLSEALELLDQLSGLNDESAPQTTRHTA